MHRISFIIFIIGLLPGLAHAQRTVYIETNTPSANVFADSTWIGRASDAPFQIGTHVRRISVMKAGLDEWSGLPIVFDMELEGQLDNNTDLTIHALFPEVVDNVRIPDIHVGTGSVMKKRTWITYAAAGASLLAGAVAIHLRTKADSRFNSYLESGSPVLKREIKRLDFQSGMALGVMQVGVGIIAFRLVF